MSSTGPEQNSAGPALVINPAVDDDDDSDDGILPPISASKSV